MGSAILHVMAEHDLHPSKSRSIFAFIDGASHRLADSRQDILFRGACVGDRQKLHARRTMESPVLSVLVQTGAKHRKQVLFQE